MGEYAMTDPWQSLSSRSHMAGRLLFNLGDAVDRSVHAAARPLQERRLFTTPLDELAESSKLSIASEAA